MTRHAVDSEPIYITILFIIENRFTRIRKVIPISGDQLVDISVMYEYWTLGIIQTTFLCKMSQDVSTVQDTENHSIDQYEILQL